MSTELEEIQKTIEQYLVFEYEKWDHLPDCFYPDCHMHGSDGKEHINVPVTVLVGGEGVASRGEQRHDRLVTIDIAGPTLAYVRCQIVDGPHHYTDHHCMVKDQGKWQIASKLFADTSDWTEYGFVDAREQDKQLAKIREAIFAYLDGIIEADADKMLSPFADDAEFVTTREDGTIMVEQAVPLLRDYMENIRPEKIEGARHEFIQHIEMSGPYTALAKVFCAEHPQYYVDYLLFVAVGDEWKIAAKVSMSEKKE